MLKLNRICLAFVVCIVPTVALAQAPVSLTHQGALAALAFSPDGRVLTGASGDGTLVRWNRADREPLEAIAVPGDADRPEAVQQLVYLAGGKWLASAGDDQAVWLFDVATGQPFEKLTASTGEIDALAASPDGKWLAAGDRKGAVHLWQLTPQGTLATAPPKAAPGEVPAGAKPVWSTAVDGAVQGLSFSADSQFLAGAGEKTVIVWDLAAKKQALEFTPDSAPLALAFRPKGATPQLAVGCQDRTVLLWDCSAKTARQTGKLAGHRGSVHTLAYSPDGRRLAAASTDVILWNVDDQTEHSTLRGFKGTVTALAYSPDGRTLAAASGEDALGTVVSRIQLADVGDGAQRQLLAGHADRVFAVAFAHDGKSLASAGGDGVRFWDAATGETTRKIERSEGILALAYSPDGKALAFGGHDRGVTLWDITAGRERATLKGHRSYITCLAFAPDGQRMATGDRDFAVKLWDIAADPPREVETITAREVSTVIFTPGKFDLAFGTRGPDGANLGEVILWRKTNPVILPLPQFPRCLSLSPDGKTLAAACRDFTVRLWSLEDEPASQGIFREHGEEVYAVSFSPDGKSLASGGNDNQALIWDAATRKVRQTLVGHVGRVTGVAYSPDGKTLATSSNDKTVRLWDVAP